MGIKGFPIVDRLAEIYTWAHDALDQERLSGTSNAYKQKSCHVAEEVCTKTQEDQKFVLPGTHLFPWEHLFLAQKTDINFPEDQIEIRDDIPFGVINHKTQECPYFEEHCFCTSAGPHVPLACKLFPVTALRSDDHLALFTQKSKSTPSVPFVANRAVVWSKLSIWLPDAFWHFQGNKQYPGYNNYTIISDYFKIPF